MSSSKKPQIITESTLNLLKGTHVFRPVGDAVFTSSDSAAEVVTANLSKKITDNLGDEMEIVSYIVVSIENNSSNYRNAIGCAQAFEVK